ncbi:selenium-dependent molybdenum cofactor biosynthesis protein YqeB [Acetohalobium arabaticum]|uniref:Selenium-dependent molybdenum hydroxylase system protein, YqeB family n=1 Tax=Acetohalobium arabaticum (strain ATCC 49924 / DSM 5501 / Z-7288) TaxID=574087 RepID=D9QUW0_ACEAZ|nr:selenium-dependent molybdenum cofactor biosynthesis protein YqeB [Acetohalobium arabaticum]ADL12019.1 selenium-dependent molybdenum hydroxylase system protein, YqeB family [Acetohalobium arabaticum DSM 5501]
MIKEISNISDIKVLIKGGGDLATGIAYRLFQSGFTVACSELDEPSMVRRTVSFGEAVYQGEWEVEGIKARLINNKREFEQTVNDRNIPVFIADKMSLFKEVLSPQVIVDARMLKRVNDTVINEAPIVIGCGPGFSANSDVDAVVETNRGHYLGRVIYSGSAQDNTGVPGEIMGYARERVLFAPGSGVFTSSKKIGDEIKAGEEFGKVNDKVVSAAISGVIRGQIYPGIKVKEGMKIGDIDPRNKNDHCYTISDKALAIGGGVLEAILNLLNR